ARGYGMNRRHAERRRLRDPDDRRPQVDVLRRRGAVLRHPARTRQGLAPVAAFEPARRPHLRGRAADRPRWKRRGIDPGHARQSAGWRNTMTPLCTVGLLLVASCSTTMG